jgi:hypothetical protein
MRGLLILFPLSQFPLSAFQMEPPHVVSDKKKKAGTSAGTGLEILKQTYRARTR